MKFSDIKVGYIYNVIFDPVHACEFNSKHLSLVLKKNNDKSTFIVMPLTSAPNGNGVNKIQLGQIESLPPSLKINTTYAVYNQIRTVNADRFISLKDESSVVESKMDEKMFDNLLSLGIRELTFSLSQDKKIEILKKAYEEEIVLKAVYLAYDILKFKKESSDYQENISRIKKEIKAILKNIPYSLGQKYIDDGIKDIFDDAIEK